MYKVYFNLLGTWTLLDNNKDSINGFRPSIFVEEHLFNYKQPQIFFTIIHNNKHYNMNYNNIIYVDADED